uniref:Uncharacterized protein n=1 Tax=Manihot esculenta TaxID=3983 RepID=A0A2C9VQ13_MANES
MTMFRYQTIVTLKSEQEDWSLTCSSLFHLLIALHFFISLVL